MHWAHGPEPCEYGMQPLIWHHMALDKIHGATRIKLLARREPATRNTQPPANSNYDSKGGRPHGGLKSRFA